MRHDALLIAAAVALCAWPHFADKPRAAFVFTALYCVAASLLHGGVVGVVLALLWAAPAACGMWFEGLSSKEVGVCDEGTGMPVEALGYIAVLFLAARVVTRKRT